MTPTTIGDRLKALRVASGMSIRLVAKLSGVSSGHICELEIGAARNPSLNTLLHLCSIYRITVSKFTEGMK
jgi:transcriptional regulator with XRE-family HTH domain